MHAAERGETELVNIMLSHYADPKFVNKDSKTALFYTINNPEKKEFPEIIKILAPLSDVNIISKEGDTCLLRAVDQEFFTIVEILLANKADINFQNMKTCI